MILLPLLLLPVVAWANSPHLWVGYVFAYLYFAMRFNRWGRKV